MKNLDKIPVDEFTTPCPLTVEESDSIERVEEMMHEHLFRHLPVVRDEVPVGVISERDLLRAVRRTETGLIASDIMQPNVYTVQSSDSLGSVAFDMVRQKIGSAIVVGEDNKLVGIFTSTDALNALIELLRGDLESDLLDTYDPAAM
jgi:acetoin utilization protein AcuB